MEKAKSKGNVMKETVAIIPVERIQKCILLIRNHKVILDSDLATLYRVKPIALRQQVKRNIKRFPSDFMYQLTDEEVTVLLSQNVIPSRKSLGGHNPYVFTEQGVAMLSSVLRSKRAVQINIAIMRVFVKLREFLADNAELRRKIEKHDEQIKYIFKRLEGTRMLPEPEKPREPFGFRPKKAKQKRPGSKKATK